MFGRLFGRPGDLTEINVNEAKRRQDAGAVLVDVREPYEWHSGHAKDARHIPLRDLSHRLAEIPKDREVLIICRSGNRSRAAAAILQRAEYRVANVAGGTMAWMRHGLPLD